VEVVAVNSSLILLLLLLLLLAATAAVTIDLAKLGYLESTEYSAWSIQQFGARHHSSSRTSPGEPGLADLLLPFRANTASLRSPARHHPALSVLAKPATR
jgi:hypothetical protein